MNEFAYLRDILSPLNNTDRIIDWPFIDIDAGREYRIYYKVDTWNSNEGGHGFDFFVAKWVGCSADHGLWDLESCQVECMYCGNARFDGMRHLYMGSEQTGDYGYDYYASIDDHIAVLNALKELEMKHCRDWNK